MIAYIVVLYFNTGKSTPYTNNLYKMTGLVNNFTATIYKYYESDVRITETIDDKIHLQTIVRSLVNFCKKQFYAIKMEQGLPLKLHQGRLQI